MQLSGGSIEAQTELALRNCAAVLRGAGHDASQSMRLVVFITEPADAAPVRAIAARWLLRTGDGTEEGDGPTPPPPLLLVQVRALPMGARVEAVLEARAPGSDAALGRFTVFVRLQPASHAIMARCDVSLGCVSSGIAHGSAWIGLSAAEGARLTHREAAAAVTAAVAQLQSRRIGSGSSGTAWGEAAGADARHVPLTLHGLTPLAAGAPLFATLWCDEVVCDDAVGLADAVRRDLAAAGHRCVALGLPSRGLHGGSHGGDRVGVAVQLSFATMMPSEGRADGDA